MFVYTIQPVVQPVVKPVWQRVVSCKRGFKMTLKAAVSVMCRMSDGREFHTVGPATANARSSNLVTIDGLQYMWECQGNERFLWLTKCRLKIALFRPVKNVSRITGRSKQLNRNCLTFLFKGTEMKFKWMARLESPQRRSHGPLMQHYFLRWPWTLTAWSWPLNVSYTNVTENCAHITATCC